MMIVPLLMSLVPLNSALAGGGSSVGPANPASVNCIKLGGGLESAVDSDGNSFGLCVIGLWALYKEMNDRGLVKPHPGGPGVGMPNPAALNCVEIGGGVRSIETPNGYHDVCVVEEWDLFKAIDVTQEFN